MYHSPPPGTGLATIGIGTGTLAYTGINAITLGMLAALLIIAGLVLLRISLLRSAEADVSGTVA